jgi:LPXTG-motif cell wall-anchored protein
VTTNPTDQTVDGGDPVTFTSAATGSPNPTVQWQVSTDGGTTWTDRPGATATTLTITTTAGDNGNRYRAVFTNAAGNDVSSAAVLTVRSEPVVIAQPEDQTVAPGHAVSFTVDMTGNPAPTVQWQVSTNRAVDWKSIAGATSPTLTFVPTRVQNGNQYRALLTNELGTTATDPVTLSVTAAPVEPTPTTEPTGTPAPAPTGTPRQTPLPSTGQDLTVGRIALALLLAGTALAVLARRRRAHP